MADTQQDPMLKLLATMGKQQHVNSIIDYALEVLPAGQTQVTAIDALFALGDVVGPIFVDAGVNPEDIPNFATRMSNSGLFKGIMMEVSRQATQRAGGDPNAVPQILAPAAPTGVQNDPAGSAETTAERDRLYRRAEALASVGEFDWENRDHVISNSATIDSADRRRFMLQSIEANARAAAEQGLVSNFQDFNRFEVNGLNISSGRRQELLQVSQDFIALQEELRLAMEEVAESLPPTIADDLEPEQPANLPPQQPNLPPEPDPEPPSNSGQASGGLGRAYLDNLRAELGLTEADIAKVEAFWAQGKTFEELNSFVISLNKPTNADITDEQSDLNQPDPPPQAEEDPNVSATSQFTRRVAIPGTPGVNRSGATQTGTNAPSGPSASLTGAIQRARSANLRTEHVRPSFQPQSKPAPPPSAHGSTMSGILGGVTSAPTAAPAVSGRAPTPAPTPAFEKGTNVIDLFNSRTARPAQEAAPRAPRLTSLIRQARAS